MNATELLGWLEDHGWTAMVEDDDTVTATCERKGRTVRRTYRRDQGLLGPFWRIER